MGSRWRGREEGTAGNNSGHRRFDQVRVPETIRLDLDPHRRKKLDLSHPCVLEKETPEPERSSMTAPPYSFRHFQLAYDKVPEILDYLMAVRTRTAR